MGSEVQTVEGIGTLALKEPGATLNSVVKAMLTDEPVSAPVWNAKAPAQVVMTDDLVRALTVLPAVFAKQQVGEVRQLTPEELAAVAEEQETIDGILRPLNTRLAAIKDAIRNHLDLRAVAQGRVTEETEVDSNGHYVVARLKQPDILPMPGTDTVWSNEYRSGSPQIQGEKLLDMYEAGKITREQYLSFTREVRVFDEAKAFAAIAKDPSLLGVLKQIVKRGRPGNSLYVRNR